MLSWLFYANEEKEEEKTVALICKSTAPQTSCSRSNLSLLSSGRRRFPVENRLPTYVTNRLSTNLPVYHADMLSFMQVASALAGEYITLFVIKVINRSVCLIGARLHFKRWSPV